MTTKLTPARALVLDEIQRLARLGIQDATGGELNSALVSRGIGSASHPSWHRRAAELVESGHLEVGPARRCRVSGRVVQTYRLPRPRGRVIDLVASFVGSSSIEATPKINNVVDDLVDGCLAEVW